MDPRVYSFWNMGIWFATAVAYLFCVDDVLSYFVIPDHDFTNVIVGLFMSVMVYQTNVDLRNYLKSKL